MFESAIIVRLRIGLAAMLVCGLLPGGVAQAASPRPLGAETASRTRGSSTGLPTRTLKVELRCVPIAATQLAAGPGPGSVVVGTSTRVDTGPVLTVRSGFAREAPTVLQLRVANGEPAAVSLQQVAEQWTLDAIWAAAPEHAAGMSAARGVAAASAAGLLRRESRVSMRELQVVPRWPGGAQPVQVWVSARQSAQPASEMAAGRAGLLVQTRLSVALDQWAPLARLPASSGPSTEASAPGQEWQLRISVEPE